MMDKSQSKYFETLRMSGHVLEMLDQRVLPNRLEYLQYGSAAAVAEGIKTMVVRGAPAIGVAAAYGVALEASRLQSLDKLSFDSGMEAGLKLLSQSRPTAVNLFWAIERMQRKWHTIYASTPQTIAKVLMTEAELIHSEDIRVNKSMGSHGAALLKDGQRVLTHCNAGALATAGHGTALGVIRSARESGKRVSVIADETRPFLQGSRLTAWELLQDGFDVTIITDNMAGHMMSQGEVDAVIVGADRVAANGDVANKIGTYMVAVLAQRHGIPFYVAAPISTIDMRIRTGREIAIEERPSIEVTSYGGVSWAAKGAKVRNPSFDVTPAELVSALITELGVVHSPSKEKLEALFDLN